MKTTIGFLLLTVIALAIRLWDVNDRLNHVTKRLKDLESRELHRHYTRHWNRNN